MGKGAVKVGITGSIGMGKTTVALEISKHNYPVWNADQAVHSLYEVGNEGYRIIKELAPGAVIGPYVDRDLLAKKLFKKPGLIKTIENKIHPLVDKNRKDFLKQHKNKQIIIFDIPLLFETQSEVWLDCVIVATAPMSVQKRRVLSRKNMTEEIFLYLLSRQLSDLEKVERADFIINTNCKYELMVSEIKTVLKRIKNDYN